ncbi:MAG: pyrimidine 5'-nucleotidase [Anaerolineae bacterium]
MSAKYILFDLDETLYPRDAGLMQEISKRISLYMAEKMGFSSEKVKRLRNEYSQLYGTTLRGLHIHYHIDPDEFLEYVHDIPLDHYLRPDKALDEMLADIPLEKFIFTNASEKHARRVLEALGISHHFPRILDIRAVDYISKPDERAYQCALKLLKAKGEECIIVEDNVRNLKAAKELGMTTVLVDKEPENDIVDFTIKNIVELKKVIDIIQGMGSGRAT